MERKHKNVSTFGNKKKVEACDILRGKVGQLPIRAQFERRESLEGKTVCMVLTGRVRMIFLQQCDNVWLVLCVNSTNSALLNILSNTNAVFTMMCDITDNFIINQPMWLSKEMCVSLQFFNLFLLFFCLTILCVLCEYTALCHVFLFFFILFASGYMLQTERWTCPPWLLSSCSSQLWARQKRRKPRRRNSSGKSSHI